MTAEAYRERIKRAVDPAFRFDPLMVCYLTDDADPGEIARGFARKVVATCKLYPAHATTNAEHGVIDIYKVFPVLERMQRIGMPLLIHGEVTDSTIDIFDLEAVFIERVFSKINVAFPGLKTVFEHINRAIYRLQLEEVGAEIIEVDSARACLEAVSTAIADGGPFHLVLLDQMMPEMSGGEAALELQALPERDRPVLVMTSSMSEPLTAKQAALLGLAATLVKPVGHEHLVSTLCGLLGHGSDAEVGEEESDRNEAESQLAAPESCGRVLLAEDNEINTLLASTLLEQLGFSVTCVVNGREAVEASAVEHFDLILMDVQMPQMDGLEATRTIRARDGRGRTPIVAMTANAMRCDREACLAAGMDDFISKPIDTEVFVAVLQRMFEPEAASSEEATPDELYWRTGH